MSTHPLATARLLERAATASTEPDHHHVEAAYQAAQACALLPDNALEWSDTDIETAADIAALRMALASAATLARRLYDNATIPDLPDFLYKIAGHYVGQLEALMADLEQLADGRDHRPAHLPGPRRRPHRLTP